jgi:hypothetical protein
MSDESKNGKKESSEPELRKKRTREEKQAEHMDRIQRTLIASLLGILAGGVSFFMREDPTTGILVVLIAIIIQRYLFLPLRRGLSSLGSKDWFYQGFVTFSFWFITWTIFLTAA